LCAVFWSFRTQTDGTHNARIVWGLVITGSGSWFSNLSTVCILVSQPVVVVLPDERRARGSRIALPSSRRADLIRDSLTIRTGLWFFLRPGRPSRMAEENGCHTFHQYIMALEWSSRAPDWIPSVCWYAYLALF
jgi:hypothetical protein